MSWRPVSSLKNSGEMFSDVKEVAVKQDESSPQIRPESLGSHRIGRCHFLSAAAAVCGAAAISGAASAQTPDSKGITMKPTIILVHGAWADASSWNPVVAQLQKAGFTVMAPPNPLRGLASDASTVASFMKSVTGPVVLVGHSYGGSVISAASAGDSNVKALVYVDAFVPDTGESCLSLLAGGTPPPSDMFLAVPTAAGNDADLFFNPKYYGSVFASDQPASISAVMAVTQRPVTNSGLNDKALAAQGWKTIPSWYVIGDADQVIPPKAQLFMATRAKAQITHAPNAGHPSMLSHPEVTVAAILAAASAVSKKAA
jgi:pimeloyl-ACP methyl ester carboxylesterase